MPPRSSSSNRLRGLSINEIHQELARRQKKLRALERRRATLVRRIDALDEQIAAHGGSAGSTRGMGSRARNDQSLGEALAGVLKGKTMSVTDAARAVVESGYRTNSPNFRTMVNAALLNKKVFKRVERGQYTAA